MKYAYVSAFLAGLAQTSLALDTHRSPCLETCQAVDNQCRTAPNANQSTCSANLAACQAKCVVPTSASLTQAPVATHSTVPIHEEVVTICHVCEEAAAKDHEHCKAECQTKENECRVAPGANQSTCSANYAGCEAKCPPPHHHKDKCHVKCHDALNHCRTKPGANQSTCSAEFASCEAKCPHHHEDECHGKCPPPHHHEDKCHVKCQDAVNHCRTKPGANQSTCSAEFAGCEAKCHLTPTPRPHHEDECHVKCHDDDNHCRTKPGANLSTCASEFEGCKSKCPLPPTPPPHHDGDECEAKCQTIDNECRTKPGANQSTCSAELAGCKAKCPVRTITSVPHSVPTTDNKVVINHNENGQQCIVECDTIYTECCAVPGAKVEVCAHEKEVCYKRCPAGHNNGTVLTAGSERMQPAFVAVAALGLAALF